jgi:peroxiredoxin
MKINQTILRVMGVLAVFCGAALQAAEVTTPRKDPNLAPMFALQNQDGKEVKLSDFTDKGKIVVLEWLNYDCPFVKAEYKDGVTKRLAEKYAKQNVVWLAINSTNYAEAQGDQAFIKEHTLPYPILLDKDGKVGKLYKAMTTPHLFIIDTKGKIVYRGAIDNAPLGKKPENEAYVNYVEKALDELLAGKAVSTPQTKSYGCSVKYAEPAKPKSQANTAKPKPRRSNTGGGYRPGYY